MIPKERICITERAALGFHAGWISRQSGRPVVNPEGTRLLYELYPLPIRRWITNGDLEQCPLFDDFCLS